MGRIALTGLVIGLAVGYALANGFGHAIDWLDFRAWVLGQPVEQGVWNPYWGKLVLLPLAVLPTRAGHAGLNLANLAAVLLLSRSVWPLLMSPLHSLLWYGNIDGFVAGGVGAAREKNPYLAGVGLFLVSIKPQFGPLALYYLVKRHDVRLLAAPLVGFLLSLVVFGNWLPEWLALMPPTPKPEVSVSLWPWSLPIWAVLPWVRDKERFVALATALTVPYFNELSLTVLMAFCWPWELLVFWIAYGWAGMGQAIAPAGLVYLLWPSKSEVKWKSLLLSC